MVKIDLVIRTNTKRYESNDLEFLSVPRVDEVVYDEDRNSGYVTQVWNYPNKIIVHADNLRRR